MQAERWTMNRLGGRGADESYASEVVNKSISVRPQYVVFRGEIGQQNDVVDSRQLD